MADRPKTIADIGEDALVELLTESLPPSRGVLHGPGDDCAVLRGPTTDRHALLKTDCVVEGVHYRADTPPQQVGHKAMARAISDIAAMGGYPRHALVTLIIEPARELRYLRALYRGLTKCAAAHGVAIVGGETSRPAKRGGASISVSISGEVERQHLCLRSGGRPGDALFVTGRLGGSINGHHLRFAPRLAEARWLAAQAKPRAMMDLSDGLAADLPRLAKASACGYRIDPTALPLRRGCSISQALGDGEDYELLLAVPRARVDRLTAQWKRKFPRIPLTRIGQLAAEGTAEPALAGGWTHF